jgi:Flp pilus assembly protein CpaB
MQSGSTSSRVLRLGALATRLLARRRRWLRWAAIGLAVVTLISAAAQLRRRPVPRRAATSPASLRSGPAPGAGTALRASGVAGLVPAGMRAVNLVVPAAATFGGRLAPGSRVDLLAAFDAGQDRAVRRVLASGVVLHVTPQDGPSAAGAPMFSAGALRAGAGPVTEVALLVPAAREREIVMAQAFGRMFLAVDPAGAGGPTAAARRRAQAGPPHAGGDEPLSLRRYLGLNVTGAAPAAAPFLPAPVPPWPAAATPVPAPLAPARPSPPHAAASSAQVTVEVIEGTARSTAEVEP